MEIENVARVRFASRRAAENQRHLAIGRGLLRQIVIDAERRFPFFVREIFGDRATAVRRDELQWRRIGSRRDNHDRVIHRTSGLESFHDGRDGRALLPDRDVHADDARALLIDDRIDRDRRLAGAAIADDQLALSATDRNHRVDGFDAGLQRLFHRLTDDDARRHELDRTRGCHIDRAGAIDRLAECVDHPPENLRARHHLEQSTGAANLVAFLELEVVTHDCGAHRILLQVEHEADHDLAGFAGGELEHLACDGAAKAVDEGDTVFHFEHGTDVVDVHGTEVSGLDFLEQNVLQFAGAQHRIRGHGTHSSKVKVRSRNSL